MTVVTFSTSPAMMAAPPKASSRPWASATLETLRQALSEHGRPQIFNSDQRVQFTSEAFTGVLESAGVAISMDGRGRALDNVFVERLWRTVKYEEVYLKDYAGVPAAVEGLGTYFDFYNQERPHQALAYQTPEAMYLGLARAERTVLCLQG